MSDAHRLVLTTSRCGDRSTCWQGSCSCGEWTKGPHFSPLTVEAYWRDHVHYIEDSIDLSAGIVDWADPS